GAHGGRAVQAIYVACTCLLPAPPALLIAIGENARLPFGRHVASVEDILALPVVRIRGHHSLHARLTVDDFESGVDAGAVDQALLDALPLSLRVVGGAHPCAVRVLVVGDAAGRIE